MREISGRVWFSTMGEISRIGCSRPYGGPRFSFGIYSPEVMSLEMPPNPVTRTEAFGCERFFESGGGPPHSRTLARGHERKAFLLRFPDGPACPSICLGRHHCKHRAWTPPQIPRAS